MKLMDFFDPHLRDMARKNAQSQTDVAQLKAALRQLAERVDRQVIFIRVLKEMFLAVSGTNEEEFLARLAQAVEKQAAENANVKTCGKCGKPMGPKQNRCIYCGESRPSELL
jgi:hypothetical protein